MNIAFPAIFIFLLVLPGFAFRSSFKKSEKTNLDHKPFAETTFSSVLAAMVLHYFWISVARLTTGYKVDYQTAFTLLVGQRGHDLDRAITLAMQHPQAIFLYHSSLLFFALTTSTVLRKVITKYKLDQKGFLKSYLRFDTPWYYLFSGIGINHDTQIMGGVYVSVVIPLNKDVTFLYTGILKEYFFDKDGNLERLLITNASRRKIEDDKTAEDSVQETTPVDHKDCFYPIDGDYLVLRYSEIVTLNIQYIIINKT